MLTVSMTNLTGRRILGINAFKKFGMNVMPAFDSAAFVISANAAVCFRE